MCTVRLNVWWHIGLYRPEMAEPRVEGGGDAGTRFWQINSPYLNQGGRLYPPHYYSPPSPKIFRPSAIPAYVLATQLLEMFTLEIQVKQMLPDSIRCDLGRLNDVSWIYLQKITISSKETLPCSNNVRIKSLGRVKKTLPNMISMC